MVFPAGFCINCTLDDLDEVRLHSLHWNLEMFQFGKGRFRSNLRVIHTEHLQVSLGWRSTGILVRGQVPRDCVTFSTVVKAEAPIHFRGAVLAPDEMAALRHGEEIELGTSRGSRLLTVSVDAEMLDRRMTALLGGPLDFWRCHERLRISPERRHDRLNHALVRFLNLALASRVTACPDGVRLLENRILETVISSIGCPPIQVLRPQRLTLAKLAEEYLRTHAGTPVSVSELCGITGINQRTLFLGFQERYGLTPMAYYKLLRLNGVRRELLNAAPVDPNASVTRLAMQWGFSHLGRFSVEYRAMFGESPIETLKRPSGRANGSESRRVAFRARPASPFR